MTKRQPPTHFGNNNSNNSRLQIGSLPAKESCKRRLRFSDLSLHSRSARYSDTITTSFDQLDCILPDQKTLKEVTSWTLLLYWFNLAKARADDTNSNKRDFYKLLVTGQLLITDNVIRESPLQPRVLQVQSKIRMLLKAA